MSADGRVTVETNLQDVTSGDVRLELASRGDSRLRRLGWASAPVLTFIALIVLWGVLVAVFARWGSTCRAPARWRSVRRLRL